MEFQRKSAFRSPPKEWIEHRLDNLRETLEKDTKLSALALKDLLGMIEMEAVPCECAIENGQLIQNRAYYVAYSKVETASKNLPKSTYSQVDTLAKQFC